MCPSNSATPSPVNQPTHSEILTVEDLATWLRVSKRSVYEIDRTDFLYQVEC